MNKLYKHLKTREAKSSRFYGAVKLFSLTMFLSFMAFAAFAQSIKISGTVKDTKGEIIPGVSVKVKGTSTGTVTSDDGKFSLTVPSSQSVLVFSFIGYDTKEVTVGNSTNIVVAIQDQNNSLNDVVVVGYGVQKKVNVIGSVATIDAKAIENRPVTNLSSSLGDRKSVV